MSASTKRPVGVDTVSLRRRLMTALLGVSLISVFLLGALNYYNARSLLTNAVGAALSGEATAQAQEIQSSLARLQATVAVTAASGRIADDLNAFSAAYAALESQPDALTADERLALEAWYQANLIDRVQAAGLPAPILEDVLPASQAGAYLQYHYIVENPNDAPERSLWVDAAGDTSRYGRVHSERQSGLDRLRDTLGLQDMLLVDMGGNVVYSTDKGLDFGTNLARGPYRESGLAQLVSRRLATAPVGDAVYSDFEFYLPAAARPTMFVAAAVRSEARTIGALVFTVPIDALNRLVTSDGRWEEVGLGDTGDVYVVGADRLIRSEPRLWTEDQDGYLAAIEASGLYPTVGVTMRSPRHARSHSVGRYRGGERSARRVDLHRKCRGLSRASDADVCGPGGCRGP